MLFVPNGSSEASPMENSYQGNPVVVINLTYDAGIGGGNDINGDIVIELFHNWSPVTVNNFVNFENILYAFYLNAIYLLIGISLFYFSFSKARKKGSLINMGE